MLNGTIRNLSLLYWKNGILGVELMMYGKNLRLEKWKIG
jgi:hypothetical protein